MFLGTCISSCDSFLEEKSQDLIVPKTINEYKELLLGEAYFSDTEACPYLEVMTDDVVEHINHRAYYEEDHRSNVYGYYTWQKDPEISATGARVYDKAWEIYYHRILMSNIVLDKAKNGENGVALEGTEEELNDLLAECYFLKAHSYFILANLYGDPYNESTSSTDLCVPINNDISVEDKTYNRETVSKIYEEINFNMNECLKYFEKTNIQKTYFRANKYAAYLLASRIALYQFRYQDVVDYTTKLLMEKNTIYDLRTYDERYFINTNNPEIIFTCGTFDDDAFSTSVKGRLEYSPELLNLYGDSDLRMSTFFRKNSKGYQLRKCISSSKSVYDICFRISEAYLNRAEALCHIDGKYTEAISDILKIRENRINGDYSVSASNKEEAIEIVKRERRMELCFENHRWFDLRRWGRPEISHTFSPMDGEGAAKTFTLEKNDPAYTLQIPKMILEMNNSIKKNNRPDRSGK